MRILTAGLLALILVACGDVAVTPSAAPSDSPTPVATEVVPNASPPPSSVQPAPDAEGSVYAPNPGAIVVAIDPGHGGCLDWGVPDPQERGPQFSEKAITMALATALAERIRADGSHAVLLREGDVALAGDNYPSLGCDGPPWRDVNGDGVSGFGPDVPEATRTRDELQARLDLANVVAADVLVSLHVDSITDAAGTPVPIARTETFYTDETPWGASITPRLATVVQESVVAAFADSGYERQDRGTNSHNLYIVAPPLFELTEERDDRARQPTRGALMPALLVEVGSITLPEEHVYLLSQEGIAAAAGGLFDGLAAFLGERPLAARIALADGELGTLPPVTDGDGPPFWAPIAPDGPLRLRVTNSGTESWASGAQLVAGWEVSEQPYLYQAPDELDALGDPLPALEPGESVVLEVELAAAPGSERALAWISLSYGNDLLADHGAPALQFASEAP